MFLIAGLLLKLLLDKLNPNSEADIDSDYDEIGYWQTEGSSPFNFLGIRETSEKLQLHDNVDNYPVIAIFDTGIDCSHQAFKNQKFYKNNLTDKEKKSLGRCFIPPEDDKDHHHDPFSDQHGHGTFCAAIAAGGIYNATNMDQRENDFTNGIAPFAQLISVKVMRKARGSKGYKRPSVGKPEYVRDGLKWILELDGDPDPPPKIDIISLSLGWPEYSSVVAEIRELLYVAQQRGIIVVCAASNEGRRGQTTIAYPARFGDVICVGSHDNMGQAAPHSPVGREIDFLAPGVDILSAFSTKSKNCVSNFSIRKWSGTSYATPFVAGIIALVIANAKQMNYDIRKIKSTAVMRSLLRNRMASRPRQHDEVYGYGHLNSFEFFKFGDSFFKEQLDKASGMPDCEGIFKVREYFRNIYDDYGSSFIPERMKEVLYLILSCL